MIELDQPPLAVRLRPPVRMGTTTTDAFGFDTLQTPELGSVGLNLVNASPLTNVSIVQGMPDAMAITHLPGMVTLGRSEEWSSVNIGAALANVDAGGVWSRALSVWKRHRALTLPVEFTDWPTGLATQSAIVDAGIPISITLRPEIQKLLSVSDNWDGAGAASPNAISLYGAERVLMELEKWALVPRRIVPSVEGGVAIAFSKGRKYADIEALNSGTLLAVTSAENLEPEVWEIEAGAIQESIRRIRDFINA